MPLEAPAATPARTAPDAIAARNDMADVAGRIRQAMTANPNDAAVLKSLEQALATMPRHPDLRRLLFDWIQAPGLQPQIRGVLVVFIVSNIRDDAAHFDLRSFGVHPESDAAKAIWRGMRGYLDAGINALNLLGQFQRGAITAEVAPKFVVALFKSGSSLLGVCLGNMIKLANGHELDDKPFEWRGYPAWWKLHRFHDWDLRPEIGADPLFQQYPGGVYKGHIEPHEKNFAILDLYENARYVITTRDPRDQIVAAYCHMRRTRPDRDIPSADVVHGELDDFMRSGLCVEYLRFAGKWLARRDTDRSTVVTYEQLTTTPTKALERLNALYDLKLDASQLEDVFRYASSITDRVGGHERSGLDRTLYPLGWSGSVGIHETYFSAGNHDTFSRLFDAFAVTAAPWADAIADVYGDLRQR